MLGINKTPQNNNNKPKNAPNTADVIDGLTSDVDRPRSMQDDVIRLAQEVQRRQVSAEVSSSVGSDVSRTCQADLLKLKKMEEFCKVRMHFGRCVTSSRDCCLYVFSGDERIDV